MNEPAVTPPLVPAADPEPEGIVDVQGKKMVPVDALIAERERATKKGEEKARAEIEPLKVKAAQADQLAADLQALQPHIDYLNKHRELFDRPAEPDTPTVSDEEAEKEARDLELYTPTGLDIPRAKRIIAKRRAEVSAVAKQAAQEAVQPYAQSSFTAAARQNFVWAASQKGPDGAPLVDTQELAKLWQSFPPELAANPEVAQIILNAAIGETVRSGKRPQRPDQEPVFSETPGGRHQGEYRMSALEKSVAKVAGISEDQFAKRAKEYQPDAVNVLGD